MNLQQASVSRPLAAPAESAHDILWVTYRWMSLGLAVTGLVAWLVAQSPAELEVVLGNRPVFYGLLLAQLGLVYAFNSVAVRASTAAAAAMFFAYAGLTGVTFSVLFLVYTASSIASTFAVSAGAFAGLSVFGALTRRDLSTVGRFATFALIGLILASVVNLFLASTALVWITTLAGVAIFAALTAYDTQKLMELYATGGGGNLALRGALTLYLDFINMFLFLLRLLGRRRD
ncbi:MAG: Bax inhibitor-1/YccA family protein [Verrucomicrobia bacterium]|nr:Bax inhibitor-1/YccA family protein [Verrucomicrobiota bacterium]